MTEKTNPTPRARKTSTKAASAKTTSKTVAKTAAKTAAKTSAETDAVEESQAVSTLRGIRDSVGDRVDAVRDSVSSGIGAARGAAGKTASAFGAAGRAYFAGVGEIGRTLLGFGREVYTDTVEHVQASFKAKDLRSVAELQAAFIQNRVEQSAAHANELVEVARDQVEASIKPFIDLLDEKQAA